MAKEQNRTEHVDDCTLLSMLTRALLDVRSLLDQSFVFVRLSELLASRA